MKLSIISFTENGEQLSGRIAELLGNELEIALYTKCRAGRNEAARSDILFVDTAPADWAKTQMREKHALLFIGACGIAVRAVAPFLTDKLKDAPVLVADEQGKYIIPILSGHMGGANGLARHIAEKMGAEAVITTATDIHKKFAVDLFAKRNNFYIVNKDGIAKVSAKVLAGKEITASIETGHEILGTEAGITLVPYPPAGFVDVVVSSGADAFDASIRLKPREYVIGLGCKKGKSEAEIEAFISQKIKALGISTAELSAVASIVQKRGEPGILAWCRKEGIPFLTYTAEELQGVCGSFTESGFVRAQVGVANVCERAAVKACGENGRLLLSKTAENGMTIAIARREWKVYFDGK
ncbi:MAG: cobalamin biosynthesis protein [Muribaculaceae bacterium]|nr:cobalamin biosynthesis protein [Roseburia sp.]MCM1431956.1 cobalamin biosynthesis protein [Muribaculaceae bacterium]MCM1493586.1 cobalamin biosynthesis protein [Muribaculaceae bacterium]